jgi:hypothetical protein
LLPGEDMRLALEVVLAREGCTAAYVLPGIGSLAQACLCRRRDSASVAGDSRSSRGTRSAGRAGGAESRRRTGAKCICRLERIADRHEVSIGQIEAAIGA